MTLLYRLAKGLFFFWFRGLNHLVISGKENLSDDRPMIVFANHYSDCDPMILPLIFQDQIFFMAKKELFQVPVVKSVVQAYGAFPVDRKNIDIGAIKTALKLMKEKKVLGIFPEGTRVRDRQKSEPKGGFSMIAVKTGAVLQPVRIQYKRKIHFLNRIDVTIGKPISALDLSLEEKTPEEYTRISGELMKGVYDLP